MTINEKKINDNRTYEQGLQTKGEELGFSFLNDALNSKYGSKYHNQKQILIVFYKSNL